MRAIQIDRPGGYERLKLVEMQTPSPGPGEVRVASEAIGVNYADCIVRMGLYSSAKKYVGWPITPGFEFAGTVEAVGDRVEGWRVGDRVVGLTRFGAYATHVVVPEFQLFKYPTSWSAQRAASFPTVHLTAWYALFHLCRPEQGMRVLVHSAAGGVGMAALQLCRVLGLEATGVVRGGHKVEQALAAGATHVVDRTEQSLPAALRRLAPSGYHIVLDSSGVDTLSHSYDALAETGHLVLFGLATMLPSSGRRVNKLALAWKFLCTPRFNPVWMIEQNRSVSGFNLSYLFDQQLRMADAMSTLMRWAEKGHLAEPPIRSFPLGKCGEAQALLETGNSVGKLVLLV